MSAADRVVILGGAGFIGRHLTAQLRGHVAHLRVVGRTARPADDAVLGADVEYLRADVTQRAALAAAIKGATVVYQLTIESDFIRGAENVATVCLEGGVRRLIFASTSDALYLGGRGPVSFEQGPDPRADLRNPYSRGKVESEKLLLQWHRERGLPVVIVRPCLVVGPGGRLAHGGIGTWNDEICLLGWGDGKNPMPFVLVQDVASGMVKALDAPGIEGMSFNLGGDVFLSARDYVRLLAERTGRNFRFYSRNLAWMYATGEAKAVLKWALRVPSEERQTYRDLKSSAMVGAIDNSNAKALLGWKPNESLDVFVREAIDSHLVDT
jgi:nucleoside-diphosphate-sugar epimerase